MRKTTLVGAALLSTAIGPARPVLAGGEYLASEEPITLDIFSHKKLFVYDDNWPIELATAAASNVTQDAFNIMLASDDTPDIVGGQALKESFNQLGLEAPRNVDEIYAILTEFRAQVLNSNGLKDEIPVFNREWEEMQRLVTMWDGHTSGADSHNDFYLNDDQICHDYMENSVKEGIKNFSKWNAEGLIDPETFTQGGELAENQPRFKWLPVGEEIAHKTQFFENLPWKFFTRGTGLETGYCFWGFDVWDEAAGKTEANWSKIRAFTVIDAQTNVPPSDRTVRYGWVEASHPRLWTNSRTLATFKKDVAKDLSYYSWHVFVKKSAKGGMDHDIMAEPSRYENDQRTPPAWRQPNIDYQELVYAIRHLAIAGKVLENPAYLRRVKEWQLPACPWEIDSATSRPYTDEWAFCVSVALVRGFYWLHDLPPEEERVFARHHLFERTRQTVDHLIKHAKIQPFLCNSHAVCGVSAVPIPACITMRGEGAEAKEWLDPSINFLSTSYTPWGDNAGRGAEGPHYWMSSTAHLTEAANLVRPNFGIDLYQRPFIQQTGDFPAYTNSPDTRRAAIQHRLGDPKEHIQFVFKSSPYGSASHSHGDQNAFCLAGFAEERENHIYIKGDTTEAYKHFNFSETKVQREVHFVRDSYYVFIDINWLCQTNGEYDLGKSNFRCNVEKTGFPDVGPSEYDGLAVSTALHVKFPKEKRHRIAILLVSYSMEAPKRVFHFLDDQGYDRDFYFTDADENAFKITIQKLAKA
ncbi:hypothetical protein AB9F29_16520 [Falsihalocynthiibacter sp. S25ZX9]|uniref:hypothetical protein n=1 Tax=Falsihalocynthiibacter sp. S25ZX9 TaxID=3240870 RepID=UPI00350EA55C